MSTIREIVESIDTPLRYLGDEINTLETARLALDSGSRPSRQGASAAENRRLSASEANGHTSGSRRTRRQASFAASREPAPRARKPGRKTGSSLSRRPLKAVTPDQLEALLSENGGLTTTALAEQTKTDRSQVLLLLRELEIAGRIRRTGQRRSTRWHAITDEDRIRERAAELEATRKRPA
jgi:hypothetical protein